MSKKELGALNWYASGGARIPNGNDEEEAEVTNGKLCKSILYFVLRCLPTG